MIHEVYEEGAAARDGRLWPGDQILEVVLDSSDWIDWITLDSSASMNVKLFKVLWLPLLDRLCTAALRLSALTCCLQVNGVNLRGAAHQEAIAALRQTPARVRLLVLRDESQYGDEENLDVFTVELQKKSGRGLGLTIVGKRWMKETHTCAVCWLARTVCVCVCQEWQWRVHLRGGQRGRC